MKRDDQLDREAEEFRNRAAADLAKSGVTGEYFCDSQREQWLDELRVAYKEAVTGNLPEPVWLKTNKPPSPRP